MGCLAYEQYVPTVMNARVNPYYKLAGYPASLKFPMQKHSMPHFSFVIPKSQGQGPGTVVVGCLVRCILTDVLLWGRPLKSPSLHRSLSLLLPTSPYSLRPTHPPFLPPSVPPGLAPSLPASSLQHSVHCVCVASCTEYCIGLGSNHAYHWDNIFI